MKNIEQLKGFPMNPATDHKRSQLFLVLLEQKNSFRIFKTDSANSFHEPDYTYLSCLLEVVSRSYRIYLVSNQQPDEFYISVCLIIYLFSVCLLVQLQTVYSASLDFSSVDLVCFFLFYSMMGRIG